MRPIDRGTAPANYTRYEDAGPDLRKRLGPYCSYCERRIETNLAVEHVQPKSLVPALSTNWDNLLLACTNCNSIKGKTPIILADYFWPDVDNTLRAFEYGPDGLIGPHPCLMPTMAKKATATLQLTGLDRDPSNYGRKLASDYRWQRRQEVWEKAKMCRDTLTSQDTVKVRELIVENATACGMFSIWWTVFAGDVDMRQRLREAFVGTDAGSFDGKENPVPRAGGQL